MSEDTSTRYDVIAVITLVIALVAVGALYVVLVL